jgi:hypothetical protein
MLRTKGINLCFGYTFKKVLIVALIAMLLLAIMIPGFLILGLHIGIRQILVDIPRLRIGVRETLVSPDKEFAEETTFSNYIDNGHTASFVQDALNKDAWASANIHNKFGLVLVNDAASDGQSQILRMLLSKGAPPDGLIDIDIGPPSPLNVWTTPLNTAIIYDQPEIVRILLTAGADPYRHFFSAGNSETPYDDGLVSQNAEIREIMKSLGPPPVTKPSGN